MRVLRFPVSPLPGISGIFRVLPRGLHPAASQDRLFWKHPLLRRRKGRCSPGRWPPAVRQLETRARTAAEAFRPELRPSASPPPVATCDRGEPRGLPQLSERSFAPARGRGSFHGALATTLWAWGTLLPPTADEMLRVYSNSTVESPPRAAPAKNGLLRKRVRKGFHITGPKT